MWRWWSAFGLCFHTGKVMRMSTIESPDGSSAVRMNFTVPVSTVMHHDIRTEHSCSQKHFQGSTSWSTETAASIFSHNYMPHPSLQYHGFSCEKRTVSCFSKCTLRAQLSGINNEILQKMEQQAHFPRRHYSSSKETIEKKLIHLMAMWEVEDAVALLRESVEGGIIPHNNVVLNLQQQLGNLGEVECLLELHDFLKEHNLTSDDRFFQCLQEAYYNSGRISEGVAVLRLLYHRTRKFSDVDIYFTLLTVMVIQHFPERLELILSFVTDLKDAEEPVLEPEASLWKCYILTGKWSEADDLLLNNEELRSLLPQQVARICQHVDRVQCDHVAVLTHLMDFPFIRRKLRVLVIETLITELVSQKQWLKLLKLLKKVKSLGLPLHVNKLSPALDAIQRHVTPQHDEQIQDLRLWCDSLEGRDEE